MVSCTMTTTAVTSPTTKTSKKHDCVSGVLTGPVAGVDDAQEGDDDSGAGITERENGPDAEREGDGGDADARV